MPTCTKGAITKIMSGPVKVKLMGVQIGKFNLKNQRLNESWNNCNCPDGKTYKEGKCIKAIANEKGEKLKGTATFKPFTVTYDLTVDTEREIVNCEYDCVKKEASKKEQKDKGKVF